MSKTIKKNGYVPGLRDTAQQIWLAGLGAFALAGEEGGKLFGTLVERGGHVEKMNKARVNRLLHKAQTKATAVRGRAGRGFQRIAAPIDTGMTAALHSFGVPTRKEISTLSKRVEALTKAVEKGRRRPARAAAR
jgi:poly(hydroxyalkanoate) granule-associated protein